MGVLSRRVEVLYIKMKAIHIQSVFALKYYTRWGRSLKIRKLIVIWCWPVIIIQNGILY